MLLYPGVNIIYFTYLSNIIPRPQQLIIWVVICFLYLGTNGQFAKLFKTNEIDPWIGLIYRRKKQVTLPQKNAQSHKESMAWVFLYCFSYNQW